MREQQKFSVTFRDDSISNLKKLEFTKLIESQLAILQKKGIPIDFIDRLHEIKHHAIKHAQKIKSPTGQCIIIPVIPKSILPLPTQMSLLQNDKRVGTTNLKSDAIEYCIPQDTIIPDRPYYIFDVYFGLNRSTCTPEYIKRALSRQHPQQRRGITPEEAIALALFTGLHQHHHIVCAGADYVGMMPILAECSIPLDQYTAEENRNPGAAPKRPILDRTYPPLTSEKKKVPTCEIEIVC